MPQLFFTKAKCDQHGPRAVFLNYFLLTDQLKKRPIFRSSQFKKTEVNVVWNIYIIPGPSKGCPGWTTIHYLEMDTHWLDGPGIFVKSWRYRPNIPIHLTSPRRRSVHAPSPCQWTQHILAGSNSGNVSETYACAACRGTFKERGRTTMSLSVGNVRNMFFHTLKYFSHRSFLSIRSKNLPLTLLCVSIYWGQRLTLMDQDEGLLISRS